MVFLERSDHCTLIACLYISGKYGVGGGSRIFSSSPEVVVNASEILAATSVSVAGIKGNPGK